MWIHRIPVSESHDCSVLIEHSSGQTCRVSVRLSVGPAGPVITLALDDPAFHFLFTPVRTTNHPDPG